MNVIKVSEDNHGYLATCDSYESAVWYLIQSGYIKLHTEIFIHNIPHSIYELTHFNKDTPYTTKVQKRVYKYLISQFDMTSDIWDDWIYFEADEIVSAVPV